MKLLWTSSNKIGSKIISWGTDSDCSHFAVCFDDGIKSGIVFHSQLHGGVDIQPWPYFYESHKIVHAMKPKAAMEEEAIYQVMVKMFYGRQYDKRAFAYFSLCVLRYKIFGISLPDRNYWGDRDSFLCTEIARALQVLGMGLPERDLGMTCPHDLHSLFNRDIWEDIDPSKVLDRSAE